MGLDLLLHQLQELATPLGFQHFTPYLRLTDRFAHARWMLLSFAQWESFTGLGGGDSILIQTLRSNQTNKLFQTGRGMSLRQKG